MKKANPTKTTPHPPVQPTQTNPQLLTTIFTSAICFAVLKTVYEFGMLSEWSLYRLVSERHSNCPTFENFQHHLQDMVGDELLACVQQSRHDLYHKGKNILPGAPGQNAYHLTAIGEDYLASRGVRLSFGMNPQCFAEALACSDALLQLGGLFPAPIILRGPAALVVWENSAGQVLLSPDGLLIQPAVHEKPEQAYLVMLQRENDSSAIGLVIERYELLLQPAIGWEWSNWGLSKMPILLFLDQIGNIARYAEELERWQKLNGDYAILTLADLWQGELNIHLLTC